MRELEVYTGNSNFSTVHLDKEIPGISDIMGTRDVNKLERKLQSERNKDSRVLGVVGDRNITITLYDNQNWVARVWSLKLNISGHYKMY